MIKSADHWTWCGKMVFWTRWCLQKNEALGNVFANGHTQSRLLTPSSVTIFPVDMAVSMRACCMRASLRAGVCL